MLKTQNPHFAKHTQPQTEKPRAYKKKSVIAFGEFIILLGWTLARYHQNNDESLLTKKSKKLFGMLLYLKNIVSGQMSFDTGLLSPLASLQWNLLITTFNPELCDVVIWFQVATTSTQG